eukprot:CAMPEP_0117658106 /NCGR_PEP_ID=MMETSP0804-20121206/5687_1 /TAXON_ID=1074897 /ORGANISM="Tetraselmis astigmatica, Strain CCMP880" /LENGTH=528 /DNA_ID=CAMNT_0005464605 /DNA_START=120 /DNA_END=1707 /DNA_ORIENTATION=-
MRGNTPGKQFKYHTQPLLGSWSKVPSADDRDEEEMPSSLLGPAASRAAALLIAQAVEEEEEPAAGVKEDSEEEPAGSPAEQFIPLADSPTTDGPEADARPSYSERRQAQQEASARLAEHRKQRMPWMVDVLTRISSPLLRLHTEITEFVRLVTPTDSEKADREVALQRARDLVTSIWPSADLQVFGSYATDMYLPTSDIDCVVLNSGLTDVAAGLKALATASLRKNLAQNIQVIAKATVPLFKYEDIETGVKLDISFNVANGPAAASYVLDIMKKFPPMRPLVIVLKVFLQQRELNEVYSGGIGSYALLVMVAAFLQTHPSRFQPELQRPRSGNGEIEGSLGVLLVDFMRLYGRTLNIDTTGVSCTNGGRFFSKRERGFLQDGRPFLLSVEDPNDAANDLARNSYNVLHIRAAFDHAYHELTAPAKRNESVLARIFRLDPVLMEREAVNGCDSEEEEGEADVQQGDKRKREHSKGSKGKGKERGASRDGGNDGHGGGSSKHKHRRHKADSSKRRSRSREHGYAAKFYY